MMNQVHEAVKCTNTDRAPVIGVAHNLLKETFGAHLHQLNCNIHPLDGMAKESRKKLKKLQILGTKNCVSKANALVLMALGLILSKLYQS